MQNGQNGVRKQTAFVILAIALANFLVLNLIRPGGVMAYILPIASWSFLAAVVLKAVGFSRIRSWFDKRVSIVALMVAVCYIVILMDIGLFVGFGNSPYSFAPLMIAINIGLVAATLLGTELSRAAIVKSFGKKSPFLAIASVSLLYTLFGVSTAKLMSLGGPLEFTKFLGVGLLPLIAENILATYLALIGGPVASLSYRAPMMAFWWFCPILPNLPWGVESLVGVMTPAVAFFVINGFIPSLTFRRAGLPVERRGFGRPRRSSAKTWMLVSIACVAVVWATTGVLGVRASTVISGSMTPALEVGDMAIVYETSPDSIAKGDIIQFWDGQEMVIHRVIEVNDVGETTLFVTKGDANSTPDPDPVQPSQVVGKVAFVIPRIGWLAIGAKTLMVGTLSFVTANAGLLAAVFVVGAGAYCMIRINRSRSFRRWARRGFAGQKMVASLGAVLFFTALSGVAYSHWSETLYINGTVNTGHWEPQVEKFSPTDDSYVSHRYPNSSWGTCPYLIVTRKPFEKRYTFLKFDLSGLPDGANILSAKLYLYGSGNGRVTARLVSDDSWNEHTITWNNMPGAGAQLDSKRIGLPRWYEWDVTSAVQQEFSGDKVLSVRLSITRGGGTFNSKEFMWARFRPYLKITHNPYVPLSPGETQDDDGFSVILNQEAGSEPQLENQLEEIMMHMEQGDVDAFLATLGG